MQYTSVWVVCGDLQRNVQNFKWPKCELRRYVFCYHLVISQQSIQECSHIWELFGFVFFFKYSFKWEKSLEKWGAQRDKGRESAPVLEVTVTCQDYNHVCTALEATVLRDIFRAQKRKRKDLKVIVNLQNMKKDNLLMAHSTSRRRRSSFMHSSLLKAIPPRSSAQKRPLGFPFCLWHGESHISNCRKKCPQDLWFQRNWIFLGFVSLHAFSLFLSVVPQQLSNDHPLSSKLDRD